MLLSSQQVLFPGRNRHKPCTSVRETRVPPVSPDLQHEPGGGRGRWGRTTRRWHARRTRTETGAQPAMSDSTHAAKRASASGTGERTRAEVELEGEQQRAASSTQFILPKFAGAPQRATPPSASLAANPRAVEIAAALASLSTPCGPSSRRPVGLCDSAGPTPSNPSQHSAPRECSRRQSNDRTPKSTLSRLCRNPERQWIPRAEAPRHLPPNRHCRSLADADRPSQAHGAVGVTEDAAGRPPLSTRAREKWYTSISPCKDDTPTRQSGDLCLPEASFEPRDLPARGRDPSPDALEDAGRQLRGGPRPPHARARARAVRGGVTGPASQYLFFVSAAARESVPPPRGSAEPPGSTLGRRAPRPRPSRWCSIRRLFANSISLCVSFSFSSSPSLYAVRHSAYRATCRSRTRLDPADAPAASRAIDADPFPDAIHESHHVVASRSTLTATARAPRRDGLYGFAHSCRVAPPRTSRPRSCRRRGRASGSNPGTLTKLRASGTLSSPLLKNMPRAACTGRPLSASDPRPKAALEYRSRGSRVRRGGVYREREFRGRRGVRRAERSRGNPTSTETPLGHVGDDERRARDGVHSAGIGGGAFPDVPVEHLRLETGPDVGAFLAGRAHLNRAIRILVPDPHDARQHPSRQPGINFNLIRTARGNAPIRASDRADCTPAPTTATPLASHSAQGLFAALPRTRRPAGASSADLISHGGARRAGRFAAPGGSRSTRDLQEHHIAAPAQGSRGRPQLDRRGREHSAVVTQKRSVLRATDPQNSPPALRREAPSGSPETRAPSRYRPAGKTDGTPRGAQGLTGPRREAKRSMSRSQSQSGETRLQRQPTPTTYGGQRASRSLVLVELNVEDGRHRASESIEAHEKSFTVSEMSEC
ncbi:hypothetical protein Q5P01_000829 [Channa striata]|uniref:Uncharacterized protein n=1 Tax=Channa striata TaxID=64152 RepID=A0AA88LEM4_CHASR|nr:hypothetical protein Q5P01_000829 [Channa striata]